MLSIFQVINAHDELKVNTCEVQYCTPIVSFWLVRNLSYLLSADFILKKDSRQAGMTDYEEKHEGLLFKQRHTVIHKQFTFKKLLSNLADKDKLFPYAS